jgi:hypothetical protein
LVVNESVNGDTTRMALERVAKVQSSYNELIRQVAKDLIDHELAWRGKDAGTLLLDGVHLNEEGHHLYTATVLSRL